MSFFKTKLPNNENKRHTTGRQPARRQIHCDPNRRTGREQPKDQGHKKEIIYQRARRARSLRVGRRRSPLCSPSTPHAASRCSHVRPSLSHVRGPQLSGSSHATAASAAAAACCCVAPAGALAAPSSSETCASAAAACVAAEPNSALVCISCVEVVEEEEGAESVVSEVVGRPELWASRREPVKEVKRDAVSCAIGIGGSGEW